MDYKRKNNRIYTNIENAIIKTDANDEEEPEGGWSDGQSSSLSSEYSESSCDSRVFEWNDFITDRFLFYIKFDLMCIAKSVNFDDDVFFRNEYKRLSIRKNENILSKLGAKGGKIKQNMFKVKILDSIKKEQLNGITKEIMLSIAPKKNMSIKEVFPLCESILGITTSLFPDGRRLMIDKIKDYSVFSKDKNVKAKDWIKGIDLEAITVDNFETILENYIKIPTIIKLTFHETIEQELNNAIEMKITNLQDLIHNGDTIFSKDEHHTFINNDLIFSMIFISKEYTQNDELDVKFCYPPRENNILFQSRGSFVTLNSIIQSTFNSKTTLTSLKIKNLTYHTSFTLYEDGILLLGFNSRYSSIYSIHQKTTQICSFLRLIYQDFTKIFNKNSPEQKELMNFCEIMKFSIKSHKNVEKFERNFVEPHFIPLPKEIQLRIDDALSELEAMDYRNWNDDLIDLFCDFTIIGSCLYFNKYLISSHLNGAYLADVETVLKNWGILEIVSVTTVKNLAIWRKIFPKEYCEFDFHKNSDAYLMLVSKSHLLMVVLLEVPVNSKHNKSLSYYVEEIQDILEHFKSTGIENLVRIWIDSNKRPQCISSTVSTSEKAEDKSRNCDEESIASSSLRNKDDNLEHDEDDNDSDWEQSMDSQKSSSGYDFNELSENRCKEFSDIIPSMLTFGSSNILFHYIQLEIGDGIYLAPVHNSNSSKHDVVMNTFRRACISIHNILQNTIKFRTLLSKESNKINRSLVAIKEQGMLLSVTKETGEKVDFWAIGRLFTAPERELYVCHRADAPQNLVELAFRICLSCAG